MADINTVATAIAAAISGTVEYTPELTVGETATKRIIVVPKAVSKSMSARGRKQVEMTVQVAIIKKATDLTISTLVTELQTTGTGFIGEKYGGLTCTGVSFPTLYGAAEMREKQIYIGVIEIALKGEE